MFILILFLPVLNYGGKSETNMGKAMKMDFFTEVELQGSGLSKDVFDLAIKGLSKLDQNGKLLKDRIKAVWVFMSPRNQL